jgi:hypothetical protein
MDIQRSHEEGEKMKKVLMDVAQEMIRATEPDFENFHSWGHCCSWLDMNSKELQGEPVFTLIKRLRKLFWHDGSEKSRKAFISCRRKLMRLVNI